MLDAVRKVFRSFSEGFEGSVPHMYLDVKGLVTVGVGNLIDAVELARSLPFRFKTSGAPANSDQITAEWAKLKQNPELAREGAKACEAVTQLDLSDDAIESLILARVTSNEDFLKRQPWFKDFDEWPADAQLGLLSMAWAMGPAGPEQFLRFRTACQQLDFNTAAKECKMNETGNPGLVPRNRANVTLFSNAAAVLAGEAQHSFQRSVLYYPADLQKRTASVTG
jgi:hypothetical protein